MYYMIYHVTYHESNKAKVVNDSEQAELLKTGEWFSTILDARKCFDDTCKKLENRRGTKRVNKSHNVQ